jgi:hypothetical protein
MRLAGRGLGEHQSLSKRLTDVSDVILPRANTIHKVAAELEMRMVGFGAYPETQ